MHITPCTSEPQSYDGFLTVANVSLITRNRTLRTIPFSNTMKICAFSKRTGVRKDSKLTPPHH